MTPLNLAAANRYHKISQNRNKKLIETLLKYGAQINTENKNKLTPIHYAAQYNDFSELEVLLKTKQGKELINSKTKKTESTPLHYAAKNNTAEVIQLLIDYDAKINLKDKKGRTPLHIAITEFSKGFSRCEKELENIRILIKNNADINITDNEEKTPLHLLLKTWSLKKEDVDLLLSKNPSINIKDNEGKTPLDYLSVENEKKSDI
ncbi:MAG: hypothetical protein GY830_09960 [Bacteroidetes bacterium]|nr:hypothetical protein [Bacteroidota bacterium]